MAIAGQVETPVDVRPIRHVDAQRVGQFLHEHLNPRIASSHWAAALRPTWQGEAPNHGYMLVHDGEIVGVQLAFYSERRGASGRERICNLAALCVRPDQRQHSFRLLRALLSQTGYSFTDLSPSGNLPPLNARLGFRPLDTGTALVVNLPWPAWAGGARLVASDAQLATLLTGHDLEIFRDHLGARAARQLALVRHGETCHVIFRRDRRKHLPLFASLLHVSNPDLLRAHAHLVFGYLLLRHGIPFTLAETRIVKYRPFPSLWLGQHRAKMFLSDHLAPEAIDYLYSELTCVAW